MAMKLAAGTPPKARRVHVAPDEKGIDKLSDAYSKPISLPSRVASLKGLTEALKNLVALEREAYGIVTQAGNEANRYEDGLKALAYMRLTPSG